MKPKSPYTIIIADDDDDDRAFLKSAFIQNKSFEVIKSFDSGVDAIKEIMINKNIPDILLIDMYMPALTGAEIIKKLIESQIALHMYKFIISTTINTAEQNKYRDNNKVKFLNKPYTPNDVSNLPNTILNYIYCDKNSQE
jgi:DNA-binding NarL/FixJ family response regulator